MHSRGPPPPPLRRTGGMSRPERLLGDDAHGRHESLAGPSGREAGRRLVLGRREARRRGRPDGAARVPGESQRAQVHAPGEALGRRSGCCHEERDPCGEGSVLHGYLRLRRSASGVPRRLGMDRDGLTHGFVGLQA